MERRGQRPNREQAGRGNGAAREAGPAPGRIPGENGLRAFIRPDGQPAKTEAVTDLREFIHRRVAENGNPQGHDENHIIVAAVVQGHRLMERAQEHPYMAGHELPAEMAVRASVVIQTQRLFAEKQPAAPRSRTGRARANNQKKA
jgi:hypothetical protein